jgi:hypothetical protein
MSCGMHIAFFSILLSPRDKNDSAESKWSPIAVYSCSRNTCP